MGEWVVLHPWMTFIILVYAICGIDNIFVNICKTIVAILDKKRNDIE